MRSAPGGYRLAAVEVCLQCIVFGLGDPKPVGGFHADLHGGVFAAESFVGWLPGGCVAVAFGRVGWPVDNDQVDGVVGEVAERFIFDCFFFPPWDSENACAP